MVLIFLALRIHFKNFGQIFSDGNKNKKASAIASGQARVDWDSLDGI